MQKVRFYNIRVGRNGGVVAKEIRALLDDPDLIALGLVEAVGYLLPHVPGWHLIRDRSTPGRANVAAYTRIKPTHIQWHDHKFTWKRTKHPGQHPPRSTLEFRLGRLQMLVCHQPPSPHINEQAQAEGIRILTREMAPWTRDEKVWERLSRNIRFVSKARPRVVVGDFNRAPRGPGPSPLRLAENINGIVLGWHIDCAVVRKVTWGQVRYFTKVNGVELGTDHPHGAFEFFIGYAERWKPGQ